MEKHEGNKFLKVLRENWGIITVVIGTFVGGVSGWTYMRAEIPRLQQDVEKSKAEILQIRIDYARIDERLTAMDKRWERVERLLDKVAESLK